MRIDYEFKDKVDLYVLIPTIILVLIGLISIYSSTFNNSTAENNFQRQFLFVLAAFMISMIIYFLPTNSFKFSSIPLYFLGIILLIAVLVVGKTVSGS
ncbi:MAG: FtsW/RodA/SpoVE family cell cycle protein, partial [Ignavibacterium sp.]|nr:FtsW/RodA/SpoVE family cell cycle protein [Ignavibacterium sp.]